MQWYERLDEKLRDYLPDMTVEHDVPMSRHTSFRIGGPALRMAFPESREQLVILLGLAEECGIRPFLLGRGTNLLVSDRGLDTLVIKTAERMTGIRRLTGPEAAFTYRHSRFLADGAVVLGAVVRLTPDDPAAIRARMDDLMARRKASQPLEWPSAGSTFKRPEGYYAGTLIDQTGLKGLTVGGAQVSEKHAGFVINTGNATCADVQELIRRVQEAVYRAHGVRLEPEVRFVGE